MNTQKIDLLGQRFGSWTVIAEAPPRYKNGRGTMWLCKCDCGMIKEVHGQLLRNGRSQSCGCKRSEKIKELHKKHPEIYRHEQKEKKPQRAISNDKIIIMANEKALELDDWAERTGISRDEILKRLLEGATPTEAVKN